MKQLTLLLIVILTSCGQGAITKSSTSNKNTLENLEKKDFITTSDTIVTYFDKYPLDSIKIEVEQYTQESSFQAKDCLPLKLLPVLNGKIPQTQEKSTGAKPVGKIQINDNNSFLIVVQQDDYGPIYYGMLYNLIENKIVKSEIIAQTWGDAGDTQIVYSLVRLINGTIHIHKYIETCHTDLDYKEKKTEEIKTTCSDSTVTIKIDYKT